METVESSLDLHSMQGSLSCNNQAAFKEVQVVYELYICWKKKKIGRPSQVKNKMNLNHESTGDISKQSHSPAISRLKIAGT